MRFNTQELKQALNLANGLEFNKQKLILLQKVNDIPYFMGTDGNMFKLIRIDINGFEFEPILFDSKIVDISNKLTAEETDINIDGAKIIVKSGKSKFELAVQDIASFPLLPEISQNETLVIDNLPSSLKLVNVAINEMANKETARGALIKAHSNGIDIVGLDGFRLNIVKLPNESNLTFEKIIPKKAISEIIKLFGDKVEIIDLHKKIAFQNDEAILITNIIQGEYMDYARILQTGAINSFKVNVSSFVGLLERAMVGYNDKIKQPLRIDIGEELKVDLNAVTFNFSETMQIEKQGDNLKIGMNARYLVEALRCCKTETVEIQYSKVLAPIAIQSESLICVVLPVRLKDGD